MGMEGKGWKVQERYYKWVLGVERGTPGYMVMEKCERVKIRGNSGKKETDTKKREKYVDCMYAWKNAREKLRKKSVF